MTAVPDGASTPANGVVSLRDFRVDNVRPATVGGSFVTAARVGICGERLDEIELALAEACVNAVVHGLPDGEGTFEVTGILCGDTIIVIARSSYDQRPSYSSNSRRLRHTMFGHIKPPQNSRAVRSVSADTP